ncbi:MAG: PKD domain-containing protein [Bacteroidia bacterium]
MKKLLQFKSLLLLVLSYFLFSSSIYSQTFEWARAAGGSSDDFAEKIAVDASGNTYTTGVFQGTVDFDPGSNTFNLISNGGWDIFIQKLDASGNFLWAISIGGTNRDRGLAIAVDASSNVYIGGILSSTADVNPGPGTNNLADCFILKLTSGGSFVWGRHTGQNAGSGFACVQDFAFDQAGNLYATGSFTGTIDFDPGPGTGSLTSSGRRPFVLKLNSLGNFIWVKGFLGVGNASSAFFGFSGSGITVDPLGNVYTAGAFADSIDFDPGPGIAFRESIKGSMFGGSLKPTFDIFIHKMDASGNFVWVKTIGGTEHDVANDIALDASGNVLVTGAYAGQVDFDPGPGTAMLTRPNNGGFSEEGSFVLKLTSAGAFGWVKGPSGESNIGQNILIDGSGNIYSSGYFYGTVDFDPGPGTQNLTSNGNGDVFIQKLNSSGNLVWAQNFGGSWNERCNGMALGPQGDIYTTGSFEASPDFDPGAAAFTLTSAGSGDIFVHKLNDCPSLSAAFTASPSGLTASFTDASTGSNISSRAWDFGDGNTSTQQNPSHSYASTSIYTVCLIVTNSCGADTICQTVSITCSPPAALADQGCSSCGEIQLSAAINGTAPNLDTEVKKNSAYATPNTLLWYGDNNGRAGRVLASTPTINTANPGSVNYWVAQSAGTGCTSTAKKVVVSVASPAPPSLTISFCPGQSVNLAGSMRDYTLNVTQWEFYNGDPNNGGTRLGRARAFRGIARRGDKVMVKPTQTTDYYVKTSYRTGGPTISKMRLTVSPNCGGPVKPIVALQGGWNVTTGQHRTQLQAQNLLPQTEPYTALGYAFNGGGGETLSAAAQLNADIVDWVIVELRDASDATQIVYSQAALLLKDGSIVDADGVSDISAPLLNTASYYIAILHRNHLGVMTAQPIALGTSVDFSNPQTATYGTATSRHIVNGKAYMYAGDADGNGQVQNTDNVMQWMPNAGASGYEPGDYNLDGQVQNSDLLQLWQPNTGRGSSVPR